VFFGFYAPGLFDICPSPIDANYPGMGMHVTMLDNMLMDDFIQKVPEWISAIIIAVSVILPVILVLFSGRITITVATLLVSLAGLVFAGFYAYYAGWWIPMAAPIIAVITAYLTSTLYSYATEGKDKRFIKNAFSRILSPKVIDQIIADPSNLKLGGDKRKMTAIFTDIQRFSSISSELQDQYGEDGPKVLVELLNLYLTEMSNIILANGGTIDKYEGDAIIAFFGAPAFMKDHAAAACRSAIQMKKREFELKNQIMIPGGDFYTPLEKLIGNNVIPFERPLFTRLGINTGDMVVGFMGTPAKMDYTIMGNAVNLAARLEGVNKQYNTHGILISEYTREYIGDEFLIRPLSRVTVVGIPIPLRLYELLEIKSDAGEEMVNMVEVWEDAFKAYENKNFDGAKKIFGGILQKDTGDKVAKLYIERCEKYIAVPPPASWDGVDNLTEK
jgi:class 3 adenylate cyclase